MIGLVTASQVQESQTLLLDPLSQIALVYHECKSVGPSEQDRFSSEDPLDLLFHVLEPALAQHNARVYTELSEQQGLNT